MIYINGLSDDLITNVKILANGTSLNDDLNKIRNCAIQWKMNFNPDPSKPAQKVIFSKKLQKTNPDPVCFNHNSVQQVLSKHLGVYLDTKY